MIQVVIFDLGDTLIDTNNRPFPHVVAALAQIATFKTLNGKRLKLCLVSDFDMPTPPVTAKKIAAIFDRYLKILDGTALRSFFEPARKCITLSTHAGVVKPDRKIFTKALERLGVAVPLKNCLFITENADHIRHVRTKLKMHALRYRASGSAKYDFDDWSQAPALIARLIGTAQFANTEAALKSHLAAKGVELVSAEPTTAARKIQITGNMWQKICVPGCDDLQDLHVAIPVSGAIARGAKGDFKIPTAMKPSAEQLAAATSFVSSLAKHGQIEGRAGKPTLQATHAIATDEHGNKRLLRKRFTAF